MSNSRPLAYERHLVLPFTLLMLCLLALLVSVFGLYRTSDVAQARLQELEMSWQVLMEDNVEGAELLATDRLMQGVARPVPAVFLASQWSLFLAALSLVFLAWLGLSARAAYRARLKSATENESNDQGALLTLLDQIAPLASGNLNVHATVRDGTPGALADAINYAVNELRSLAGTQMSTARAFSESLNKANELTASADSLCTSQSRQISDGAGVLLDISSSAAELSEHAAGVAAASKKVQSATSEGSIASSERLERIAKLHANLQNPVQLMQTLSSRVEGIDDHVNRINVVTKRIELLVLNSTLNATKGVVDAHSASSLSDINQLAAQTGSFAEQITSSTQAIRTSVLGISAENAQALSSVRTLTEIADVHLYTSTAMQQIFDEIETHCAQLQVHTAGMSEQAVLHASGVSNLSGKMDSVNQTAQQALADVKGNAETLESLKRLANDLRQSLADYNLSDPYPITPISASDDDTFGQVRSHARRAADRAVLNE